MRIDREEKRSLKRLFVGILVMAMLVTMLPYGNIGVRAEEAKFDESIFGGVEPISVASEEEFYNAINSVSDAENQTIIIQLTKPITLTKSLGFPQGNVAIDLGGNTMSVSYIFFVESEIGSNISIYGETGSAIQGYSADGMEGDSCFCELLQNYGVKLQINGEVNLKNIALDIWSGNELYINGKNLTVTGDWYVRHYKEDDYNWINANQEKTIYEYVNDNYMMAYLVSDEINQVDAFDIYSFAIPQSSQAEEDYYVKGTIPDSLKLFYQGFIYENFNQESDIIENTGLGLLRNTSSDSEIIVDAILRDYYSINQTDTSDQWIIWSDFFRCLKEEGYAKATIESGAIPKNSVDGVMNIEKIYIQEKEQLAFESEGFGFNVYFDTADDTAVQIFNESPVAVTASDNSSVWIPWKGVMEPEDSGYEYTITPGEIMTDENGVEYVKAGSQITIDPGDGVYVNQIYWGPNVLANSTQIEYRPDGTVVITVPSFAIEDQLSFVLGEIMQEPASVTYMKLPTPLFTEGMDTEAAVDCYGEPFTLSSADNYMICDADPETIGTTNWTSEEILISEEGTVTKEFYAMNVSMEVDEKDMDGDGETTDFVPSDKYGTKYYLTYTYTLDTVSPTITSVKATDAEGNSLTLDGGWLTEFDTVSVETVWTATPSVTLKVEADAGSGFPVAGYMFQDTWQTSDTYTYTGDGIYDVAIHVRDEFDTKLEAANLTRPEEGIWVTAIGIDTTAPTLLFTDAQTPTQEELKSNSTYAGNLHMVCEDGEGSGFAEINVYKQDGENWVASNDVLIATETGSYIAPTTKDAVYRIEVTDVVGNTKVYENITILGYTQDIDVIIGNTITTYGKELSIPLTITNTTEKELQISLFALRDAATDSVFQKEIGTLTKLAAGETFKTNVTIPSGVDAGTYDAMLDIQYMSVGGTLETNIAKVYSRHIEANIEKASGVGSVIVDGIYYGESINPVVASDTNGIENVVLYYREADAENSIFVKTVPTAVGTYDVRAVFPATKNYEEVTAESRFTITRMKATENMYSVSQPTGENGVYREDVIITGLDGNLLCTTEDGTYSEKLTVNETTENFSFYVKTSSGAITEKVELGKIVIERIVDGKGSVVVDDFYYGEKLTYKVSSDTNGTKNVTLYYKEKDAADRTYTKTAPSKVGSYVVKAVFAATGKYKEVIATDAFTITRMKATEKMYVVSQPTGENDIYREDVVIAGLDGNLLCPTENGTYSEKLTVNETTENFSFYVKTSSGAITEKVELGKIVIERIVDGKGSVVVDDFYYGEKLTYTVSSDTNGTKNVTLYYKEKGAADSSYTKTAPSKVGSYVVKAVFAATGKYREVIATDEFTITRMKATEKMYVVSQPTGENGVYKEDVVITGLEENLLCTTEGGAYTETLTITESVENYTFYIKTSTGAITEAVKLSNIVIDKTVVVPPQEDPVVPTPEEEIAPTAIGVGRVRLETGKAYTFGRGTWSVSGDSTSYAGGITFYVPSTGDYEITQ